MTSEATDATTAEAEPVLSPGLLVYGVLGPDTTLPEDVTGLDDAPLRAIAHEGMAAVVSDFAVERQPGRRRELLGYTEVLDALNAAGTVVPVRFGTVLPDADAVVGELLEPRTGMLRTTLDELAGRTQFTVRAHYLEQIVLGEVVAENPEIAELRELTRDAPEDTAYAERVRLGELVARALEVKQQQDVDALLGPVLEHTVAHVLRETTGIERLLEVAVLVDDRNLDAFEDSLEALAEAVHERIRVQLLGPQAPYDFVPES